MLPTTERGRDSYAPPDTAALQSAAFAIQQRVDSLVDAIRNKNIERVMWHYAPDVVVYDLTAPLDVRGAGAYRRKFERWFAAVAGRIHYEMLDVEISAGDHQGIVHCLSHITGARTGGGRLDYWVRVTSGWKTVAGQWLISHEHVSMPTLI